MKILKIALVVLVALLLLAVLGFVGWTRIARYPAAPDAAQVALAADNAGGWLTFTPEEPNGAGLIIYPGGLVDPAAYALLAQAFADRGVMTVIVPMPLDLAVFDVNQADAVIAAYPEVERWAITGHSLGGSMAAQYLATRGPQQPKLRGLALWASYAPGGVDLSSAPIEAVSIYGSNDGVMTQRGESSLLQGLPAGTPLVVVEGGNHSGFGSYGQQQGDGAATLSQAEQRERIVDATMPLFD